jgi:hypothetical protein
MRTQSTSFQAKTWGVTFKNLPTDQGLDDHAHAINVMFNLADTSHRDGEHQRINAGRMLITVQALVLAQLGPGRWESWCKKHIDRSLRDIQKVMKIAAADDPTLAHQAEVEAQQVSRAKVVAKAAKASSMPLHGGLQRSDDPLDGQKVVPIRRKAAAAVTDDDGSKIEAAAAAMEAALDTFNLTFNQRFQAVRCLEARIRKEQADVRA